MIGASSAIADYQALPLQYCRLELGTCHYGQLDDSARRVPFKPVWFLAGDE